MILSGLSFLDLYSYNPTYKNIQGMAMKSKTQQKALIKWKKSSRTFSEFPMSIKTLKLTERKGKYFRLERKSSGISDLHSSSALQIAGNHPLVNYEIFFKEEIKEKNTRLCCIKGQNFMRFLQSNICEVCDSLKCELYLVWFTTTITLKYIS